MKEVLKIIPEESVKLLLLFVFLAVPLTGIPALGQEPDADSTYFLDLRVAGDSGTPPELSQEDIKVSVDGQPREIQYFSMISPSLLETASPDSWIIANQMRGIHTMIIALDLNNLDYAALNSTKISLRSILDSLPENHNQKMMLVTLGMDMKVIQTFTSDVNKIYESLETVQSGFEKSDYKTLIESISEVFTINYDQSPEQAMNEAIREANRFLADVSSRMKSSVAGLDMLAEVMADLAGPKNLLFISGGYPMVPEPVVQDIIRAYNENDAARQILPASLLSAKLGLGGETISPGTMQSLLEKLNRNQITVFAFDSRDANADGLASSGIRWLPQRLVARHNSSHITAGREFMRMLAGPTKGEVFSSPEGILEHIRTDRQSHYLLGIEGEAGEAPAEVDVMVNVEASGGNNEGTPSVQVYSREGFFRLTRGSSEEALKGAFNFPYYYRDFSVSFNLGTAGDQVTLQAVIPTGSLSFVEERESHFCILEVYGIITDSSGKAVTNDKKYTFARQYPIRMNDSQMQNLLSRDSVTANASADGIPPGEYALTVVVRQPRTGLISASRMQIKLDNQQEPLFP